MKSVKTIETIKFNVGGQIYEITRSLLDMYPNTMLSKLVSNNWLPGYLYDDTTSAYTKATAKTVATVTSAATDILASTSNTEDYIDIDNIDIDVNNDNDEHDNNHNDDHDNEHDNNHNKSKSNNDCIFIDRDGQVFRYVLNYLRDGKAVLPITIDKNTFLHELSYYGIQVQDINQANISVNIQANAQSVLQINGLISSLEKEEYCIRFSRFCIVQFKERGSSHFDNYGKSNDTYCNEFHFIIRSIDYGEGSKKKDEGLYNAVEEVANGGEDMKERSNVYLGKFGLLLKDIDGKDVYRQRTKFKVILEVL